MFGGIPQGLVLGSTLLYFINNLEKNPLNHYQQIFQMKKAGKMVGKKGIQVSDTNG